MPKSSLDFVLFHDVIWTTTAVLPSWQGFQSRRGPYGARDKDQPSDGTIDLMIVRRGEDKSPPSAVEVAAVTWVIENEASISHAATEALFKEYRSLQQAYDYTPEERAALMPDIESAEELRTLIGLHTIHVHPSNHGEDHYSGLEFGCVWEPEHGLGILMHGNRAVKIGWADTAFYPLPKFVSDTVSESLVEAPKQFPGWPPASRNDGWVKESGAPLCGPYEDEFFSTAGAQFSIVGPLVSTTEILAVFPETFPGSDDLVEFYLRFNGGSRTPHGCIVHCGSSDHRVPRSSLDRLNLEGFRSVPRVADERMHPFANILLHHSTMARIYFQIPQMKTFLEEHIGLAFDHSGRDLCISRRSGRVFFMDWEAYKEGPVQVAPSFRDFVEKFWNIRQGPID